MHSRPGFTMAEMIVVLVLLSIVGGSLMSVLTKQQAFYSGTSDLIALRTQLRQAEAVLSSDLRGISSPGNDITTMTDSSIDFNYTTGVSVVCAAPNGGGNIVIPPTGALTNNNTLTGWIGPTPGNGDKLYIFDEGRHTTLPSDDLWKLYDIANFNPNSGSCDGGFNAPSANKVILAGNISGTILDGAAVRFMRTAHYSLYHRPGDRASNWYLGYCSPASSSGKGCDPSTPISRIAGPFQPYDATTSPDTSGIRFTYYDSTGAVTAAASQVARIGITVRGRTSGYVHIQGMKKGFAYDSLVMSIALRNRS